MELQLSVFYKGPGTGRPLCHRVWTGPVLTRRSVIIPQIACSPDRVSLFYISISLFDPLALPRLPGQDRDPVGWNKEGPGVQRTNHEAVAAPRGSHGRDRRPAGPPAVWGTVKTGQDRTGPDWPEKKELRDTIRTRQLGGIRLDWKTGLVWIGLVWSDSVS